MITRSIPKNPIIAVIGTTGTGKSQLGVDLAKRFNGEIINCDAVQMYDGLNIITNKIIPDERKGVPHHLLGCVNPREPTWTVGKFVPEALRIIQEIRDRGRLPILVGGTHYYIQSLIVQESLVESNGKAYEDSITDSFPILEEPTEVILAKLREVDPIMADRWHPGDRRRIQRSLEIFLKSGKRASDIYQDQKQSHTAGIVTDGHSTELAQSTLRFDPLVFWTFASEDSLGPRLDDRVVKMMDNGLLNEVDQLSKLREDLEAEGNSLDVTRGIWISIGYKEFEQYEAARKLGEAKQKLEILLQEGMKRVQISTRQYAKKQLRWIQTKFINALMRANAFESIYLLNGSNVAQWNAQVSRPALEITDKFLNGLDMPNSLELAGSFHDKLQSRGPDLAQNPDLWQRKTCKVCNVVATTESGWQKHVQSNRHKKTIAKRRRWEEYQQILAKKDGSNLPASNT